MAEALGLAIGAVGLLPMVCKMYRNCHETAQSVRYHSRELRYAAEKLFIQRNLFDRECRYLLQNIVSEEIAKEMIQDHVHPAWSGPTFLVDLENFVGKDFEIHFRHIRDSLEAVGCLLKKAMDQPSCQQIQSQSPLRNRARTTFRKLQYVLTGKENLRQLIELLSQQNTDLLHAIQLNARLAKQRRKAAPIPTRKMTVTTTSSLPPSRTNVREISRILYEGICATNVCTCHDLSLQLGVIPQSTTAPSPSFDEKSFSFMLTKSLPPSQEGCGKRLVECTPLTVRPEKQPLLPYSKGSNPETKRVCIAFQGPDVQLYSQPTLPGPSTNTYSRRMVIKNLCELCTEPHSTLEPIGIIVSTERVPSAEIYQHLVFYPGISPSAAAPTFRSSLDEHLPNRTMLSMEARLRLATVLAYSLLDFGSYETSWFPDHWRSKDITFFHPLQQTEVTYSDQSDEDASLIPFITPSFPRQRPSKATLKSEHTPPTAFPSPARNERLFSLALVLTEIGLECSLRNIPDPSGLFHSTTDPYAEYFKAKNIVESYGLQRQMGAIYARVVKQCFHCDFGIGDADFTKRDLQMVFYQKVVCELEKCWRKFRGG